VVVTLVDKDTYSADIGVDKGTPRNFEQKEDTLNMPQKLVFVASAAVDLSKLQRNLNID
jgi:hypothetical protein